MSAWKLRRRKFHRPEEAEITAITGHTLRDVRSILDTHYRDPALAEAAIRKPKREQNLPKQAPNYADCAE